MPDTAALLGFAGAALVISVVPGPDMLFVIASGMRRGRRGGVAAAAGIEIGVIGHLTAALLGLSAIVASSATAFEAIRIAGVAYLLWLGWASFRTAGGPLAGEGESGERSLALIARQGAITNLLNPKVAIFFVAFLPQFVDPGRPIASQLLALGLVFMAIGFAVDALVGLLSGGFARRFATSARARRALDRCAGVVFVALAARLATQRTG